MDGVVQGVGFRPFVYRIAVQRGLRGYIKNLGDAGVEIVVEGDEKEINMFLIDIKTKKPAISRIDNVRVEYGPEHGYGEFKILQSDYSPRPGSQVSTVPPDLATCQDCLTELFTPNNPRYLYPFINCTYCGPRFTILYSLPYDRCNTSMNAFPLCEECGKEYRDPSNRRYHAEPTCCHTCGPNYKLVTPGKVCKASGGEAIKLAAKLLDRGELLAIKGIGGFHLACDAKNSSSVKKLRLILGREEQPFAVMVRDLETASKYVVLSEDEEKHLVGIQRPILILEKKGGGVAPEVAPGLNTLGVMLPYTPLHTLLFHYAKVEILVMTSANLPGDPMITRDDEAYEKLGAIPYLLLHNLEIVNRTDDSVIRFVDGKPVFVRRSRGYIPFKVTITHKKRVLGVGAELSNTFCLTRGGLAYLSQHIGDTSKFSTIKFHREAISRHRHLLGLGEKLDYVVCDYHPQYRTTKEALRYNPVKGVYQLQHHFAHALSLAVEHKLLNRDLVVIAADGMGYGLNGEIWGGELLFLGGDGNFERLAHLEPQILIGGDLAVEYPVRVLYAILSKVFDDVGEELKGYHPCLRHGEREFAVMQQQLLKKINVYTTTSCGRVIDAVSTLLGICSRRTYEGEPAMKLEAAATGCPDSGCPRFEAPVLEEVEGKSLLPFTRYNNKITSSRGKVKVLQTTPLVKGIYEGYKSKKHTRKELAHGFLVSLAKGFSELALDAVEEFHLDKVGFTGGCAYNKIMTRVIRKSLEAHGVELLLQRVVPCGDGGISLGQAAMITYLEDNQHERD